MPDHQQEGPGPRIWAADAKTAYVTDHSSKARDPSSFVAFYESGMPIGIMEGSR